MMSFAAFNWKIFLFGASCGLAIAPALFVLAFKFADAQAARFTETLTRHGDDPAALARLDKKKPRQAARQWLRSFKHNR